jgi:hypothetical protein
MSNTTRVRPARAESPGRPMAVGFASLTAFGDAQGTGTSVDYLAERDEAPGTSGWSSHAITPPQDALSFYAALNLYPFYEGEMSDDLSRGVFRAWTPLGPEPNVRDVVNLYTRMDLRAAGVGTYELATPSASLLPPITNQRQVPFFGGASRDFEHLVFESRLNLTPDSSGRSSKLYKSDGGVVRLITDGSGTCPPVNAAAPCSGGGVGLSVLLVNERLISGDGSRANFSAPLNGVGTVSTAPGLVSRLYQFDDHGTASAADDVTIQLNASEKTSPDVAQEAQYQTASVDGSRVFFISFEQLTDTPGSGVYMWSRQATDESQSITVDATGGTFTLTAQRQLSVGSGTLANGSTTVTGVSGSFLAGQTISGADVPPGTTVTSVASSGDQIELSAPATADGSTALTASVQRTTDPLPWNASASQVRTALESLDIIGSGNVDVSGGAGGSAPYVVTFVGALAGVNVAPLTADAGGLTGGAGTATVATTRPVHNLTLIGDGADVVFGASEDGHRVYFGGPGQLVPGGPAISFGRGVFAWQDVDGTPGGALSFVGIVDTAAAVGNGLNRPIGTKAGRITPDGKHFLLSVGDGSGLAPAYPHGTCASNIGVFECNELYLYSADSSTPLDPDVVCASCDLSHPAAPYDARLTISQFDGVTGFTLHENHGMSDDGRVFFSTDEPLVSEDTNQRWDAYEYAPQTHQWHLLSSGKSTSDSYYMDASASGADAFFTTRERLVGWDRDDAYDLYDARVGGGFPEPPPPPSACAGDSCQGLILAPPTLTADGSSLFRGHGDARPVLRHRAKRCARGKVKKRVRGKVRCVKRHHRAKRRQASHRARRAGR